VWVDFTLDDTRVTLREVAAEVFRDAPGAAWDTLVTPEMDVLSAMVVLAEAGRAAVPLPGLALGVLPLARHGIEVPAGSRVTAALHEPSDPMTSRPRTTARGGVINGVKIGVPEAEGAYRILVPVTTDEGAAVALVDPASPGVTLNPAPTSSGSPEFSLRLVDVPCERTFDGLADLHELALVGACATADGLLAAALELTRKHVAGRQQFGRPLATFQAVAQQIADVYISARTLHLATWSACWRLSEGLESDVDIAAHWVAQELVPAIRTCHHLHGGLGLDVTYPLHRYYSLAKDLVRSIGGARHRLEALCASN
jgi:alkylation response protein AidB-like acyl-CoA dehydrogenase